MEKTNIIVTILVIGLVLTSGILAFKSKSTTIVQTNPNGQASNSITVSADGKVTAVPDKAEVYFSINTEGKTAVEAQDKNKATSNSVMSALEGKGISQKDIESTQYYVNKKYQWNPQSQKSEVIGYEVIHTLKVSTKDIENVGVLADVGVSAGATGVENIQFTLSEDKQREVKAQALKTAASSAKEKAQAIASSLGVSLGRITSVTESSLNYIPYRYDTMALEATSAPKAEPTQINPQNLEVSATVSISYEIE